MSTLAEKCRRKAETAGLTELMNNTKWKELCFAFAAMPKPPAWRTLDLLNGHLSQWEREWFHHVGQESCSIQWLEIDPRECSKEEIEAILRRVNVRFEPSNGYVKVFGYK